MIVHASESQHWYTRNGEPAYTVKSKDGTERPATLRDARKLGLVPSVTTIIKCAAAPALERWKRDQMMQAALTLPRLDGEAEAAWISRVWTDSGETARKAAERGTAIHAAIQGMYEGEHPGPGELWNHCMGADAAVSRWIKSEEGVPEVEAEKSFAHQLGFGGKVDLHGTPDFVLDFKSKEFDEKSELKTWDEQAMQLAAYREGLGMPTARAAIVYVSVTTPGLARLIEIPEEELKRGWKMFLHLLNYWKAKHKFASDFMTILVAA
jgi:hypothetical protein